MNYSRLLKGKGLREPNKENKQSTNSFTLFLCGCIKESEFYNSHSINILKLKVMQRDEVFNSVMETETIQKNGASLKSHTSRGNKIVIGG